MASKIGRNKAKCQQYRNLGKRQIAKEKKAKRHEERIKHFEKRRAEGKCYEYTPTQSKREKRLRKDKNVDRRLPIAKLDSIFSKLKNELQQKTLEEKKTLKEKK